MEKKDSKKGENNGFDREDTSRNGDNPFAPFAKDKRKRIVRTEKTEFRRREEGQQERPPRREDAPPRKPWSGGNERHSYNPNFTKDNRVRRDDDDNRFNRTDYVERTERGKPGRPSDRNFNRTDDRRTQRPERDFNNTNYNPEHGRPGRKGHVGKPAWNRDGKPSKYGRDGKHPGKSDKFKLKKDGNGRYSDGSYPAFPAPVIEDEVRLNRYIAAAGKCSRREADEIIKAGRVMVNGDVITEMGAKVKAVDIVQIDGETIRSEKKVYIVMNKPKGFVTTLEDPHAEKTVMDLLTNSCKERIYPVGRLDKNSLGVLLITNDGDLTTRLTHPSYDKKKIYQVTLDKALTRADMQQIVDGITLEDGEIHADEISYVHDNKKEIGIEIHSGRNRIVRRIFEHLGYKVTKLDRVWFAGLTKKNLKRGQWRFLTPKEVDILRSGLYE